MVVDQKRHRKNGAKKTIISPINKWRKEKRKETNTCSSIQSCCFYYAQNKKKKKNAIHAIFHYRFCVECHCFPCFILIIELHCSTFTIICVFCRRICSFVVSLFVRVYFLPTILFLGLSLGSLDRFSFHSSLAHRGLTLNL